MPSELLSVRTYKKTTTLRKKTNLLRFREASLSELDKISKRILKRAKKYKFWFFEGEMGSGKTTLINFICQELKILDSCSSPTYSIVNEYFTCDNETIAHFDMYRIEHPNELIDLSLEGYYDKCRFCFIEWPKYLDIDEYIEINIDINENTTRNFFVNHIKKIY